MRVGHVWSALALCCAAHALIDDALEVIKFGKELGEEVLNSWDVLGRPFNASGGVELPLMRRRERQVLARLARVSEAIERLERGVWAERAAAAAAWRGAARGTRLELRLHELGAALSQVEEAARRMREYVRLQTELERATLEDFAQWCVSHAPSALRGLLERVHDLTAPPRSLFGKGLLQMLAEDLQVRRC